MNKRNYIFISALVCFVSVSYTSKVTPDLSYLRNFNKAVKTGITEKWNSVMAEPYIRELLKTKKSESDKSEKAELPIGNQNLRTLVQRSAHKLCADQRRNSKFLEVPITSHIPNSISSFFGIKTVVIDAGHGGKDPGCIGKNAYEKNAALGIALKLGKYIETKIQDVKVIYTRKTDVFVDLDERAAIANRNKADLFICIHCNTACSIDKKTKNMQCNENTSGSETYVMGLHKTNANLNVAMRENQSILLEKNYRKRYDGFEPNSETGYILLNMQQNAYLKQSLNLAAKIQKQLKEKAGRVDKGVQQAGFLVLWRTAMPSVLIETEFLSNPESEKLLSSEKGQDVFARALFIAFRQYKDEVEGKYVKYDDDIEKTSPYIVPPVFRQGEGKEKNNTDDSVNVQQGKKNIIENDSEAKNAPSDSLIKNLMAPQVKDTTKTKPEIKEKKDTVAIRKDTIHSSIQPDDGAGQITYKVQFISSSQRMPLLSAQFKGLKNVGEYEDNGIYKYTTGEFKTLDEAMNLRSYMQKNGYKDCFVVKFKDGKRVKN